MTVTNKLGIVMVLILGTAALYHWGYSETGRKKQPRASWPRLLKPKPNKRATTKTFFDSRHMLIFISYTIKLMMRKGAPEINTHMEATMRRCFRFFLCGTLLILLLSMTTALLSAATGPQETRRVLVLYSFRTIMPIQAEFDQGLRAALHAKAQQPVDIEIEYLDLVRFDQAFYLEELLQLLRLKYAHRHLDAVIPVFDPAIQFMLKYGDAVFPGVPIVFAGEYKKIVDNLNLKPHMTGVMITPDFAAILELALTLRPQTRQVTVVGGTSDFDRSLLAWAQEAFESWKGKLEFSYLSDLSVDEVRERVSHLPPHTIVYFLSMMRDGKGQELVPLEVLKQLAATANAPVYGIFDIVLGEGIVGGPLVDIKEQGRLAGELVARILNGEKPEQLLPVLAPNPLRFDWRQLRRWGISEAKLPSGSVVRFREPSLWEMYRGWIIGGLALLGLQSGLIGTLLLNRSRRRRAEQGLRERLQFEEMLSGLSAAFVNLPSDQIAQEVNAWLARILEFLHIDRITVLELSKDQKSFLNIHSTTAPGIAGFPSQMPTESLSWFSRTLSQGKQLAYSHLPDDLPTEAVQEKEYCHREGLKSFISLPLQVGGSVFGVIAFTKMRDYVNWGRYPTARLNLVAEIFANAFIRRRTQQALNDRLHFEELLTDLSAAFVNLPAESVESEIKHWHGKILDCLLVERSTVHIFSPDKAELLVMSSLTITGVEPYTDVITNDIFPWYFEQVSRGEVLVLPHLPDDLAEDLLEERDYCLKSGLKSHVCVPLAVAGEVLGTLTMEYFTHYVDWPQGLIRRLRLVGEIFANALIRRKKEEALHQAEERYRIVADFTYDWEYWENQDGSLNYVSPSCERLTGYSVAEFLASPSLLVELIVSEDREIWHRHQTKIRREHHHAHPAIQFRLRRKDGEVCWVEHACRPVYGSQGEFLGFRASNRDITGRKQGELEIQRLKEQLLADYIYLQEEIKLTHDFEHIIGNSNELKYVLHKVEQVAPRDTTVLILGETGTGKELIARAIHSSSSRRHRPLIKVDCASLSPTLIESELFGHEKGAFTGALSRKIGRFELAHGSTLFLDEIGELPLELQTKLLRLVQEGEFERLGSARPLKVDVRIIAATNRDLQEEVRKGQFREDLYYRLNVFPITVPPLRQRQKDIPLLVQSFVHRFGRKMGKEITKIPPQVLETLCQYSWPGNVRELENVIERALIDTRGPVLQLGGKLSGPLPAAPTSASQSLEAVERAHIIQVLEQVGWKITGKDGAAARLKINPSTLRSRMRKLNIVHTK